MFKRCLRAPKPRGTVALCLGISVWSALGLSPARAQEAAQDPGQVEAEDGQAEVPPLPIPVTLNLSFVPTDRSQIAVWVERDDGVFVTTLALTHAVARLGIGNRPGALQMNSGFRWPYGRREGALPVWAHRRASAEGAKRWKRVIFQNRVSEGNASRNTNDQSIDDFYCLSFDTATSKQDALDAVTCASVFSSDKGRFLNAADIDYVEPFQEEGERGSLRSLGLTSLYPPRRDVDRCSARGCNDHEDVASFKSHALEVMPELDAITQATPQGQRPTRWSFPLEVDGGSKLWLSDHDYTLFIEVNVEGDSNQAYDTKRFPVPSQPENMWDNWSRTFGYPYRGQPSVVYALPFRLDGAGTIDTAVAQGYGDVHGLDGDLRALDESITDDPNSRPGSGADRLRLVGSTRATLEVSQCPKGQKPPPGAVRELKLSRHPDSLHAHIWARLSFRTPEGEAPEQYAVRIRPRDGDWEQAFTQDSENPLLPVALDVCADPKLPEKNRCLDLPPGSLLQVDLAGLRPSTVYNVSVVPRAAHCGGFGEIALVSFTTPAREFTTVSPCFIATATYGSPLASEIGVLRRFRDRHLAPHAAGRGLIAVYYALGPSLGDYVREHPWARDMSRAALDPLVRFLRWWMT